MLTSSGTRSVRGTSGERCPRLVGRHLDAKRRHRPPPSQNEKGPLSRALNLFRHVRGADRNRPMMEVLQFSPGLCDLSQPVPSRWPCVLMRHWDDSACSLCDFSRRNLPITFPQLRLGMRLNWSQPAFSTVAAWVDASVADVAPARCPGPALLRPCPSRPLDRNMHNSRSCYQAP